MNRRRRPPVVTRSYVELTDDRVGDSLAAEIANQPLLSHHKDGSSPETLAMTASEQFAFTRIQSLS